MKEQKIGVLGMAVAFGLLSAGSIAMADSPFLSMTPLVVGADSLVGTGTTVPHFVDIDTDQDGTANKVTFRYDVYETASHTKLYSTQLKAALYPSATNMCTPDQYYYEDAEQDPMFFRSGKWLITAMKLTTECSSGVSGYQEDSNTFVYIADAGVQGGEVRTIYLKHHELVGVDLIDVNSDQKDDLLLSMIVEKRNGAYIKLYAVDLDDGSVLRDEQYIVHQEK